MKTLRALTILSLTAALVAACSKSEQSADTTKPAAAATTPAPAPAPAANLADYAGKWNIAATPIEGKDTTSTKYTLTATGDTSGWMIAFPSGVTVPLQISVSGDSLLDKTGEFASQRRKGVKVQTDVVSRMQGDKIVGMTTAHYMNAGADSVLRLRTEGSKMP